MPKIMIETESPTETSPGAIREGHYTVDGGKVRVTDAAGRTIGSEKLGPGQDPALIARRILRRGRSDNSFYGALRYPPLSLV